MNNCVDIETERLRSFVFCFQIIPLSYLPPAMTETFNVLLYNITKRTHGSTQCMLFIKKTPSTHEMFCVRRSQLSHSQFEYPRLHIIIVTSPNSWGNSYLLLSLLLNPISFAILQETFFCPDCENLPLFISNSI